MKKLTWIFGALVYSFFVAIIPTFIWMLYGITQWLMANNHSTWLVYGTFFIVGSVIQFYRPLYKNNN